MDINQRKSKIIFKDYQTYEDVKKSMTRGTNLVLVLFEINETFARNYLHSLNKLLFNSFIRDVKYTQNIVKKVFDMDWSGLFHKNLTRNAHDIIILNKCKVYLKKKTPMRVKFWKSVQKNRDLFKKF